MIPDTNERWEIMEDHEMRLNFIESDLQIIKLILGVASALVLTGACAGLVWFFLGGAA